MTQELIKVVFPSFLSISSSSKYRFDRCKAAGSECYFPDGLVGRRWNVAFWNTLTIESSLNKRANAQFLKV